MPQIKWLKIQTPKDLEAENEMAENPKVDNHMAEIQMAGSCEAESRMAEKLRG